MRSGARSRSITAATALLCVVPGGCGRDRAPEPAAVGRSADSAGSPSSGPSTPAARAGDLDEAAARALLAARFRAAGFRIVADVPLAEGDVALTVDGFDPERRVGFEYLAGEERGVELDDAERGRLARVAGATLLVVDEADAAAVSALADRFLSRLPRAPVGDAGAGR